MLSRDLKKTIDMSSGEFQIILVVISSFTDCHIGLQHLKTFSMVVRLSSWSPIDTPRCHRQHRGAKDWVINNHISKSRTKLPCSKKKDSRFKRPEITPAFVRNCQRSSATSWDAHQRFNSQQYEKVGHEAWIPCASIPISAWVEQYASGGLECAFVSLWNRTCPSWCSLHTRVCCKHRWYRLEQLCQRVSWHHPSKTLVWLELSRDRTFCKNRSE